MFSYFNIFLLFEYFPRMHTLCSLMLSMPPLTKYYMILNLILTTLTTLNLMSVYCLSFTFKQTFLSLQLWRVITAGVYFGKMDGTYVIEFILACLALSKIQTSIFGYERYAEFLWFIICSFISLVIISSIFPIYFYANTFIIILLYIWCRTQPNIYVRILNIIEIKNYYFLVIFALVMIAFGSPTKCFLGLLLGEIYSRVKQHQFYPRTPIFIRNMFSESREEFQEKQKHQKVDQPPNGKGLGFFTGNPVAIG